MKFIFGIVLLAFTINPLYGGELTDYMNSYKITGKSNYSRENQIIEKYSVPKLINELTPFFNDSITAVRTKSYYLTYKNGLASKTKHQQEAILRLIEGCSDINGGIIGQNLSYLQEFPLESFNDEAKNAIHLLLLKKHSIHYKKLVLIAGYIGVGEETMRKKLLLPDIKSETKWYFSLALARLGSVEHANYCVENARKMPINNDLISYIIPDLIYTRQSQPINFCVELLNNDVKNCTSPNPDNPENILCGYYIIDLLAPVIIDFPYKTDATNSLVTEDYKKALEDIRIWFNNHPDFQVRNNIY